MTKNTIRPTDLGDFASDLDAGIFGEKIAQLISEISQSVVSEDNNPKGA